MARPQLVIFSILIAIFILAESFQARSFNASKISSSKNTYQTLLLKIKDIKESPEYLDLKRLNKEFASKVKVVDTKMNSIIANEAFYKNSTQLIADLEKEVSKNKGNKSKISRELEEVKRRRSKIEKEIKSYPEHKEQLLSKSIEYERELDEVLYPYNVLNDELEDLSNQASLMIKVNNPKYLNLKKEKKKVESRIEKLKKSRSVINSNKVLYKHSDTVIEFLKTKSSSRKNPSRTAGIITDLSRRKKMIGQEKEQYPQQEQKILKKLKVYKVALNRVNYSYTVLADEIKTLKKALKVKRNRKSISKLR